MRNKRRAKRFKMNTYRKVRLSDKQRKVLEQIHNHEQPSERFPEGIPLYAGHTFLSLDFYSEAERDRWLANLESRKLIHRSGPSKCFIRLTSIGREAIGKAPKPEK